MGARPLCGPPCCLACRLDTRRSRRSRRGPECQRHGCCPALLCSNPKLRVLNNNGGALTYNRCTNCNLSELKCKVRGLGGG